MDIPALSMAMAQGNVMNKVSVAVLDNAKEVAESAGNQLTQMIDASAMQLSVNPHIGGNIDIRV